MPIAPSTVVCARCTAGEVGEVERAVQETLSGGATIAYSEVFSACDGCGREFFTKAQSLTTSRRRALAIRNETGRYSPESIRRLRTVLGLSQADFERALGVGPKTVVRWERGTVTPSSAVNGLLFIAEQYPEQFASLARRNGVDLRVAPRKAEKYEATMGVVTIRGTGGRVIRHVGKVRREQLTLIQSGVTSLIEGDSHEIFSGTLSS